MTVTIVCFGAMREYLPPGTTGNRAGVAAPGGATVGQVVDALGAPRALVFSALVDGVQAGLDTVVPEGAEITLMPPFAGGSPRLGGRRRARRYSRPDVHVVRAQGGRSPQWGRPGPGDPES